MTYMFFLIHLETCGYFGISAYVGLGTDEWVYDGTGTASVSCFISSNSTRLELFWIRYATRCRKCGTS